jgi:hypothetical protein
MKGKYSQITRLTAARRQKGEPTAPGIQTSYEGRVATLMIDPAPLTDAVHAPVDDA